MNGPDRIAERVRIEQSFGVYSLPPWARADILEALDDPIWDWYEDCDGCTAVSELHWPTRWFPPCVRHDYDYVRGRGGMDASRRFYRLQRLYGAPRWRSGLRAAAVTVAWYGLYKYIRRPPENN